MVNTEERVAVVTGGASGIGLAIVEKLLADGLQVFVLDRSVGPAGEGLVADVSVAASISAAVDDIIAKVGKIDVLVNNAGTTQFADHADLDALSAEDFLWIYKINVIGAYQMIRACAPAMKKAGKGSVVNISSIAGVTGVGSSVAYAASKGALNTMTLSLARSLAPEIRVNAICPGFIGTRWFSDRFGEDKYQKIRKQQEASTPLARAGTPDDIAKSVVFFAGEGSDHITGETLMSDAGMHLGFAPLVAR